MFHETFGMVGLHRTNICTTRAGCPLFGDWFLTSVARGDWGEKGERGDGGDRVDGGNGGECHVRQQGN